MNVNYNLPIQLYSVTSTTGDLTPLLFKFENQSHEIITVKIHRILSKKETSYAGVSQLCYTCSAYIDGVEKYFQLNYQISSHRWTFFTEVLQ